MWLLKNAIDKKKKILWIAHRQMLLDRTAESFQKFAYAKCMPFFLNSELCQVPQVRQNSQTSKRMIICVDYGKDIGNERLDRKWLEGEKKELYWLWMKHHSTAKNIQKSYQLCKDKVPNLS